MLLSLMSFKLLASMLPALDWMNISWDACIANDLVGDSNLWWRYMNDKSNVVRVTSINYFKSFPGSAFRRFVCTESLKITPPSPSILNEPAAISTASRSTWKSVFPWGSETRNDFVCTSSLSWPRNNWFSTRPSGSLVLNVMFLDDSAS